MWHAALEGIVFGAFGALTYDIGRWWRQRKR